MGRRAAERMDTLGPRPRGRRPPRRGRRDASPRPASSCAPPGARVRDRLASSRRRPRSHPPSLLPRTRPAGTAIADRGQ
jgi:hypothetical protein